MASNLVFKQLDLTGLRVFIDLALTEGWNPGLSDAELFYVADESGFYGCFIGDELMAGVLSSLTMMTLGLWGFS